MDREVKLLINYLDGRSEIWIKYAYYFKSDWKKFYQEEVVLHRFAGQVMIQKMSARQRFYSNLKMVECPAACLDVAVLRSGGKRITKIRDILFVDSQLYVKTPDKAVLKIEDNNGFIALKIPEQEYSSILKQLTKTRWQN